MKLKLSSGVLLVKSVNEPKQTVPGWEINRFEVIDGSALAVPIVAGAIIHAESRCCYGVAYLIDDTTPALFVKASDVLAIEEPE